MVKLRVLTKYFSIFGLSVSLSKNIFIFKCGCLSGFNNLNLHLEIVFFKKSRAYKNFKIFFGPLRNTKTSNFFSHSFSQYNSKKLVRTQLKVFSCIINIDFRYVTAMPQWRPSVEACYLLTRRHYNNWWLNFDEKIGNKCNCFRVFLKLKVEFLGGSTAGLCFGLAIGLTAPLYLPAVLDMPTACLKVVGLFSRFIFWTLIRTLVFAKGTTLRNVYWEIVIYCVRSCSSFSRSFNWNYSEGIPKHWMILWSPFLVYLF